MFVYFKQSLEICPYIMFLCLFTLCPWTSGGPSPALFSFDGFILGATSENSHPDFLALPAFIPRQKTPAHRACKRTPLNLLLCSMPYESLSWSPTLSGPLLEAERVHSCFCYSPSSVSSCGREAM